MDIEVVMEGVSGLRMAKKIEQTEQTEQTERQVTDVASHRRARLFYTTGVRDAEMGLASPGRWRGCS